MSRNGEYKSEGAWDEPRGDQSQGWGSPPSAAKTRPQAGSPPMPGRASTHSAEPRMSASPVTVKYENNHSRNASGHGSSASPKRPLPAHSERDDYAQTHSLMKSQRGEPAHGRRVLFVQGFPPTMRARDLAYEFERMGPLVRVDLPALTSANAAAYGFFEYEDPQDALAAYNDMQGWRFGTYQCSVSWANKQPPRPDAGSFAYRAATGSYSHRVAEAPARRSASPTPRGHYGYAHNTSNYDYDYDRRSTNYRTSVA